MEELLLLAFLALYAIVNRKALPKPRLRRKRRPNPEATDAGE